MLSLLKKKSDAAAASTVPAWHPNFRNYEKLPDIKVVRTAFFVNAAAISIALAMAIYFGFQEWKLHVVRNQIDAQKALIERDKGPSDQAVALFKKFQAEESKIVEVDTFVKSRPIVSNLLLHVARTLPENMALEAFDLRDSGLVLRIAVKGAPEVASGLAEGYARQLKADAKLMAQFADANMTNLSRNAVTGRLAVEITLPAKPGPGGKK